MLGKLKVSNKREMRKRQNESENDQTGWKDLKNNKKIKSLGKAKCRGIKRIIE